MGDEAGGSIDLTPGESRRGSVHFHSSGLVMGVLIWQAGRVGGGGGEGRSDGGVGGFSGMRTFY